MKKGMAFLLVLLIVLPSGCRARKAESNAQNQPDPTEMPATAAKATTKEPQAQTEDHDTCHTLR